MVKLAVKSPYNPGHELIFQKDEAEFITMLNFSVHDGFKQYGKMMIFLSCSRYSLIINLLKFLSMFFQVASGWSSSSVTISRFTVDPLDPMPKLFIILYYYTVLGNCCVNKKMYNVAGRLGSPSCVKL